MKKLLILMLVLGLTTCVQAALLPIELSVNGVYDGPGNVTEKTVVPCTELTIDVQAPAGLDYTAYAIIEGAYPGANGEWGDNLGPPYLPMCNGYYFQDSGYPKIRTDVGAGVDSTVHRYEYAGWGFGYELNDTQFSGVNPGGTAFELLFHCCKPGDVTITLWDAGGDYITPNDKIIIHQLPEPATIVLLGLGGLLLRRRK